jgi:hypothetical protein
MASGDGLQANELTVKIGAASAFYSTCTDFTKSFDNFKQSGGGRDTEAVPLFGGVFLTKEKPREQIEVSFDAKWKYGTDSILDQLAMGSLLDGSSLAKSGQEPHNKVIYLQWTDGTLYYTRGYNNVSAVNLGDVEQSADGFLQGTFSFKLDAATSAGSSNVKVDNVAASTYTWSTDV